MAQGFAVFAGIGPEIIRASARESEALGYSSFWVNHPGPTDGLAALAHGAADTRAIELGVGVIPLHTRGPASIADGVKTQRLPAARLLLGVGSPNPRSLDRVRDGVAALRSQLPGVRLIVAALGPKMSRLAGEVADGVLFNWLTPEHARVSAGWVREGAAAAKRQPPKLFAYVRVAIGTAACDRLADEAARYDAIPAYNAHFVRMGVKPVDTCVAVQNADDVVPALARWRSVLDEVVVRAIVARDTIDEHVAVVRAAKPR
jgi:alkanesulfonate monooxygenase SsuD/methylene tetrahydromethanopterin reductase-like flavin-dependent oxidoreductase (luciferase family)